MRCLALSNKKVRGVRRRMRALARWSAAFSGYFPKAATPEARYWNHKLPVHQSLVEGPQARRRIQRACAQHLIDACAHLIQAKPASAKGYRVVATIVVPDLFMSEVCIYTDEAYFLSMVTPTANEHGGLTRITDQSLAVEWGLRLPEGVQELGIFHDYRPDPNLDERYTMRYWFFGEVS